MRLPQRRFAPLWSIVGKIVGRGGSIRYSSRRFGRTLVLPARSSDGPPMTRGRVSGSLHVLPARQRTDPDIAPTRKAPPAPKGLGLSGRAAWKAVMSCAPLLLPDLDTVTVERFCRVVDERAAVNVELDRGVLLEEPIVSPVRQGRGHPGGPEPRRGDAPGARQAAGRLVRPPGSRAGCPCSPRVDPDHGRTTGGGGLEPTRRQVQERGRRVTATMTKDDAEDVAREAAQRIVDAVSTFAPWVRLRLAAALADEPSDTLRSIGGSLLGKAPAATMARSLLADVFIGDLEDIAPTLGDTEPWSTIRSALEDVAAAWHTSHPGLRTRRDYTARSRSWALEAVAARRGGRVGPPRAGVGAARHHPALPAMLHARHVVDPLALRRLPRPEGHAKRPTPAATGKDK